MLTERELEQVIEKTVKSTLTTVGFDLSDPISIQADMHFLRSARRLTGAAGMKIVMVLIAIATVAVASKVFISIGKAIAQAVTS